MIQTCVTTNNELQDVFDWIGGVLVVVIRVTELLTINMCLIIICELVCWWVWVSWLSSAGLLKKIYLWSKVVLFCLSHWDLPPKSSSHFIPSSSCLRKASSWCVGCTDLVWNCWELQCGNWLVSLAEVWTYSQTTLFWILIEFSMTKITPNSISPPTCIVGLNIWNHLHKNSLH
jgi:hypothetical protein